MAIRALALVLLAWGSGGSALAQVTLYPAEQVFASGSNSHGDTTHKACSEQYTASPVQSDGCFDAHGAQCSANPGTRCAVARVPAGRCTAGSCICIWPQGAGFCVDPEPDGGLDVEQIPCLPDDPNLHSQTSGTYPSVLCAAHTGQCDMSVNDPACACQGTDPTAASWEGKICSDPVGSDWLAVCSDGDLLGGQYVGEAVAPAETIGNFGTAGCYNISLQQNPAQSTLSNCGYQSRAVGTIDTPEYQTENRLVFYTLQRKPGVGGLSPPDRAIQRVRITTASSIDQVGSGEAGQTATVLLELACHLEADQG